MCTIAGAKVQRNYNCYNVYFNECLRTVHHVPEETACDDEAWLHKMYYDMPGRMEKDIRWALISAFGRRQYFEMRKGDRLITPERQQQILDTCRRFGWQGPIIYDGEQEEWDW